MAPDYLLKIRQMLGGRPVPLTGIAVRTYASNAASPEASARYLQRLVRGCYWLNASLIAYPDLAAETPDAGSAALALRVGKQERPGVKVWKEVLSWKPVASLSAAPPDLGPAGRPQ